MSRLTYIKDLVNGALNEAYNYRYKGGYQQRKPRQEVTGNKPIFCTNVYKIPFKVNETQFNKYVVKICGITTSDMHYINEHNIGLLHMAEKPDDLKTSYEQQIYQADIMPSHLTAYFVYASIINPEAWLENEEKDSLS